MKSITFFLNFFSFASLTYSQIEFSLTANKVNLSRVKVNKPDKMTLFGVRKGKIDEVNTNFYYYHSTQGRDQTNVYLDNNDIDLFLNRNGEVFIIYASGFKKKLVSARNCYYSIEINDKNKKANFKVLYEEDKLSLKPLNLVTIFSQKGVDKYNHYSSTEILLGINPPVYFFRTYYEMPRTALSMDKYKFSIELIFPKSFLGLYKILSLDLINKSINDKILQKINEVMQQEISNVPSLAPKGEFETSEQYKKRINGGQIQKLQIEKKYQKQILAFKTLAKNEQQEKIRLSLKQVILKIDSIGRYDADKQIFPITIHGLTKNIKVPLEQAKEFKAKKDEIKVFANIQLNENGETFRILK